MHRQAVTRQTQLRTRLPGGAEEDKPLVLFVCVHNAGRSRMAEAFFNDLAGDRYRAMSAGTQPAAQPHPEVVAAMDEVGLEIPSTPGRTLTAELAEQAIRVIGMGCDIESACPALSVPLTDWELPDPKGKNLEEVGEIRDQIELRVRNLVAALDRETQAQP